LSSSIKTKQKEPFNSNNNPSKELHHKKKPPNGGKPTQFNSPSSLFDYIHPQTQHIYFPCFQKVKELKYKHI